MTSSYPSLLWYIVALPVCIVLISISTLCGKAALRDVSPPIMLLGSCVFGVSSFLAAGFFCRYWGVRAGNLHRVCIRNVYQTTAHNFKWALFATMGGAIGSWVNNIAYQHYDPAFISFLTNLNIVYLIFGGFLIGERLAVRELFPIAMSVTGAFLFSYRGGQFQWAALGLTSVGCIFNVCKYMGVKLATTPQNLTCFMPGLLFMMGTFALLGAALTGQMTVPSLRALPYIIANGFIGSFFGMALLYSIYHAIGVSRGAPFVALTPLAVLMLGLLFGCAQLPTLIQTVGGIFILAGSVLLTLCARPSRTPKS